MANYRIAEMAPGSDPDFIPGHDSIQLGFLGNLEIRPRHHLKPIVIAHITA